MRANRFFLSKVKVCERESLVKSSDLYEEAIVQRGRTGRYWTQVHSWDRYRDLSGRTAIRIASEVASDFYVLSSPTPPHGSTAFQGIFACASFEAVLLPPESTASTV